MKDLAEIAYEAYREMSQGKSLVSGQPIPPFAELPPLIRQAWDAAAQAVAAAIAANEPRNGAR